MRYSCQIILLTDHVSIGALADSYYEYLLKASIQLQDREARTLYDEAMDGFVNNGLVKVSKPSHLLYIAESRNDRAEDVVGHLACFAGNNIFISEKFLVYTGV